MKMDEDNMKKLGLAIILVGLMLVIIGFGRYFEERLRIATLTQNSMLEFKEYNIKEYGINYKLPAEWYSTELLNEVENDDKVYINEFISPDTSIYGYIEIVKSKEQFKEVIGQVEKEIKDMGNKEISSEDIEINEVMGSLVQYEFKFSEKNIKKAYEYYLPYKGYVIKASFTISDKKAKENTRVVFDNIVKTFCFK